MATATVVYPLARKVSIGTTLTAVDLDCSISETHQGDMEVTEHPVESGTNIIDHVRRKPEQLTIEGLVTDTPIRQEDRDAIGSMEKGSVTRARDAFYSLRALRDSRQTVTVVTAVKTYTNMILVSLVFPRDVTTAEACRFIAQFKEIQTVSSQRVEILLTQRASGQKKRDTGNKSSDKVTLPTQARSTLDAAIFTAPKAITP